MPMGNGPLRRSCAKEPGVLGLVPQGSDVGAEAGAAEIVELGAAGLLHQLDDDRLQPGKNAQAGALADRDQAYSGGDEARGKRPQVALAILSKEPVFAVDH